MEREPGVRGAAVHETVVTDARQPWGVEATAADGWQLRWGPIWAGLLTALGIFTLLTLLAVAIGLQAAPGTDEEIGLVGALVTGVIALVSFFVGGFVAAWAADLSHPGRALLNGFLVWALWLVLLLLIAAFGAGQIFGIAADLFGPLRVDAPEVDRNAMIRQLRDGAWSSLLALALTAAAAALGGVVGAREEVRTRWRSRW
jgi:ABC-type amino acid transport system permease subunit